MVQCGGLLRFRQFWMFLVRLLSGKVMFHITLLCVQHHSSAGCYCVVPGTGYAILTLKVRQYEY